MRLAVAAVLLATLPILPVSAAPIPGPVAPSAPAMDVPLAAHHATYKLALKEGSSTGDVVGATGTMDYQVRDACSGWAVSQRLDMHLLDANGQDVHMVSDYATWEAKDGSRLQFHMRQLTDTAVTEQVDGTATLQPGGAGGEVSYTTPTHAKMALPPGTLFPMAHTSLILRTAEQGQKFSAVPLFDGTGPDGAQDSFITITSWGKPIATPYKMLVPLPSGFTYVAFFNRKPGDQTPDYVIGMRYWSNGVGDDLAMNFGDFTMLGHLNTLAPLPSHC